MRLWAGLSTHFTAHNQIAEKLKASFFAAYRYDPPPSEVQAWRNSLRATLRGVHATVRLRILVLGA